MKQFRKYALLTAIGLGSVGAMGQENPFLQPYNTPFEIPPFEQIKAEHYLPALQEGIKQQRAEIDAIVNNPVTPTFDNTILAFEQSGKTLAKVASVFFTLDEACSTPELEQVATEFYPAYTAWTDEVGMDQRLFNRIKYLYDNLDNLNLDTARRRAVQKAYDDFVRSGAMLSPADQEKLKEVNSKLAELFLKFNKNLLNATNAFEAVVTDPAMLQGIPQNVIAVAAEEASRRNKPANTWVFTLHNPSRLPVLQYADNRALREQLYKGYTSLASSGEFNNYPVINEILRNRTQKARLLGYPDFASYMTANVMSKNPQAANDLLMQIWKPAVNRVEQEVKEMQAVADAENAGITIMPWDYYYYADKVRRQRYAFDEDAIKPYFAADSVRKGLFAMAEKLYGVTFTEIPGAPKYHPDVNVYEVKDKNTGEHIAVFMTDFYTRPSKRQGAWMEMMTPAFVDPDGTVGRPIVYNVANFAPPTADTPSLCDLDNIETAFHEFGHALQGMLTRAELRSQAGTNVDRDYVEMSSQMHEHFAFQPELTKEYAHHYLTGETVPAELIEKINASSTHNEGFATAELAGAALLDLRYGALNVEPEDTVDIAAFEAKVSEEIGMPKELTYRYRSPYFKHIFGSDGYASGYYTYLWAETLDRDAFDLFEQTGVFNPETAASFKKNILEPGGSEDPMVLYVRFRGHKPTVEPLLRKRGLINND